MSEQVQISIEGQMGVIALNRPEAINALNLEMIEAIRARLTLWAVDGAIKAVLFEGRGSKGFCAGGDVRAVRAAVLSDNHAGADAFFVSEYGMNGQIARYPKPVVAITHGVVMGGGLGIAGHARYRFTTPEARFAMPEAAIGFFCDVGVNAILSRSPVHRALLFELSGVPVGAADALALGLTDCAILPERLAEVRRLIVGAADSSNVDAALTGIMEAESIQAGERTFCDLADRLEERWRGKRSAILRPQSKNQGWRQSCSACCGRARPPARKQSCAVIWRRVVPLQSKTCCRWTSNCPIF
jgi:enoyl-CoA hydratase